MTGRVRRVVVAGGGTAGWMTAAALARSLPQLDIRLVESDAIGTVGVGEATMPPILQFGALLGLDEAEVMRATGATFKLGIVFDGWRREGDAYMHPFGGYGRDVDGVRFYQLWRRYAAEGGGAPLGAFCLSEVAARLGRFAAPSRDPRDVLSSLAYAYHLDAGLYARLLRAYAEARGVRRTEGRIVETERCEAGVATLRLEGGEQVEGDFFVDCTGFGARLIGDALGAPFEDWSRWLPCDSALAVASERTKALPPYTVAAAREAGWQWRIPLQHRTGNGLVYASAHLDEEAARVQLLGHLGTEPVGEPRKLSFRTGRRREAWRGNVVAIGLSAGFLEPLESTSIHLIQTAIQKLLALFPGAGPAEAERRAFNGLMAKSFEQIRDFLVLHYRASEREEPFWRAVRSAAPPDSLAERLDLFEANGRVFRHEDELFAEDNWLAVMSGQGLRPRRLDPLAAAMPSEDLQGTLARIGAMIQSAAGRLPTHADYVARTCPMTKDMQ